MTNHVKRGAGRGTHSARTSRAAQRTPLPPRGAGPGWSGREEVAADVREKLGIKTCGHCGQRLPHQGTSWQESGACRRVAEEDETDG